MRLNSSVETVYFSNILSLPKATAFLLTIPFEPKIGHLTVPVHLLLEYAAFFIAYRYYVRLRKSKADVISTSNRLSIILGAAVGALLGSRIMGFLEHPVFIWSLELLNVKTIMGGLFGGLMGVECTKKIIGESHSSGDLFTLPIVVGIFIGRIGCFLAGTHEVTYGTPTSLLTGMDLGDGVPRHPIALYEILFLLTLFFILKRLLNQNKYEPGFVFQIFMLSYFGFRFLIEFIKPNAFFILGLSSIQWLCVLCFVYYRNTLIRTLRAN